MAAEERDGRQGGDCGVDGSPVELPHRARADPVRSTQMRESMQLRSWRLCAAVALVVVMLSCGVPAYAAETGGLSVLRKFPAAVTAIGVGSVSGAPLTVVATRGAGIYATMAGGAT